LSIYTDFIFNRDQFRLRLISPLTIFGAEYFQVLSAKLPIKIGTSYCKFIK